MWTAIIGRIPTDNHDSCYIYHLSPNEALKQFEEDIYANNFQNKDDWNVNVKLFGHGVYVHWVLCSETEIKKESI